MTEWLPLTEKEFDELRRLQRQTSNGEAEFEKAEMFPEFVWIKDFISLAGSVVYGKEVPGDIDIIVRADEDDERYEISLDPGLRLKIDRILRKRFDVESSDWIGSRTGPNWSYVGIYDLVLRPRENLKIVDMDEPDFEGEFYKEFPVEIEGEFVEPGEFFKVHIEEFRERGSDADIRNPKARYKNLLAALRYLGNSAYPKLKAGEEWGGLTLSECKRYFAAIVDALRGIYFPIMPPMIGDAKFNTSYWELYRDAQKLMKSKPPKKEDVPEWDSQRKKLLGGVEKQVIIFEKKEDEHIVCGIVYEPDEEDAQGDEASVEEIRLAAHKFMEGNQVFKLLHKGKRIKAHVLESYLSPVDFTAENGDMVKKGSWIVSIRILDKGVWGKIVGGELTGFSMSGFAVV